MNYNTYDEEHKEVVSRNLRKYHFHAKRCGRLSRDTTPELHRDKYIELGKSLNIVTQM